MASIKLVTVDFCNLIVESLKLSVDFAILYGRVDLCEVISASFKLPVDLCEFGIGKSRCQLMY